jgi:serine/threonine protein kinase
LEEFVIERVLGSGGFGITYLARDTRLDRQVVIKENLPAQFCFRDTHSLTVAARLTHGEDADNFRWSLENFSKEAAMLASLDHQGIVKVLRSFEAFGTAYFVMPYLEGLTFDELIVSRQDKGQVFSEDELRGFLYRVLGALDYLHDRGVYHRDIKPGNLFVTLEGMPVLIDFGSARQRLSERSMTVIESAGYTPFEQLQSRGNVGPWSDLYALAATLVKVMTGEAPPKANDRTMWDPWQPLSGRSELAGSYSEVFLACLDRALKLRVEDRWQSADNWWHTLSGRDVKVPAKAVAAPPARTAAPPLPVPATRSVIQSFPPDGESAEWEKNPNTTQAVVAACVVFLLIGFAFLQTIRSTHVTEEAAIADAPARKEEMGAKVGPSELPELVKPIVKESLTNELTGTTPGGEREFETVRRAPAMANELTAPLGLLGAVDVVKLMQESLRANQIKEFTFDQVLGWEAGGNEVVYGETYQTGVAAYKSETIFGAKTIQAKALIQGGEVKKWIWLNSGVEIK